MQYAPKCSYRPHMEGFRAVIEELNDESFNGFIVTIEKIVRTEIPDVGRAEIVNMFETLFEGECVLFFREHQRWPQRHEMRSCIQQLILQPEILIRCARDLRRPMAEKAEEMREEFKRILLNKQRNKRRNRGEDAD